MCPMRKTPYELSIKKNGDFVFSYEDSLVAFQSGLVELTNLIESKPE